jgi:hypothetical protein
MSRRPATLIQTDIARVIRAARRRGDRSLALTGRPRVARSCTRLSGCGLVSSAPARSLSPSAPHPCSLIGTDPNQIGPCVRVLPSLIWLTLEVARGFLRPETLGA